MAGRILVIIHIGFDQDTILSINDLPIVFMKSQLDIRLPELDLLEAECSSGMEKP